MCVVPPGVGAVVDVILVAVRNGAQLRAGGSGLFRYDPPSVSSILPKYVLVGPQTLQFVVLGTNLGVRNVSGATPEIMVAGV